MSYQVLSRIPWTFLACRQLMGWNVPGAWRLYHKFVRPLLKSKVAPFPLEDGSTAYVPLTWPGMATGRGLEGYEPDAIAAFASRVRSLPGPVTLIDCGADIGMFTRLVLAKVSNICRIIAYEPNPDPFELLRMNLEGCGIPTDLRNSAVSSAAGQAKLIVDDTEEHNHAAFITSRGHDGIPTAVETIDQLDLPPAVAIGLKIDVEGEELKVLEGAKATLQRCSAFVVLFEAHPLVAVRTRTDPSQCLALLRDLGARCWVAYCGQKVREAAHGISPGRPFFEQVRPEEIYNVIAIRDAPVARGE